MDGIGGGGRRDLPHMADALASAAYKEGLNGSRPGLLRRSYAASPFSQRLIQPGASHFTFDSDSSGTPSEADRIERTRPSSAI
jgi:hypothetical protein